MQKIPEYVHATASELGAGIVISTRSGIIGRIIQFTDYTEMLTQTNSGNWIAYAVVPAYNILIVYAGVIGRGYKLIDRPEAVEQEMKKQAAWYLSEKVQPHHSRFKRYLT